MAIALLLVNKNRKSLYLLKDKFEMHLVQYLYFFFKANQLLPLLLNGCIPFLKSSSFLFLQPYELSKIRVIQHFIHAS